MERRPVERPGVPISPAEVGPDVLPAIVYDRRKCVVLGHIVVNGKPQLLQIVRTLSPPGRLTSRLHGGQKQRNEHGDNGDDDQQFDQSETAPTLHEAPPGEKTERDNDGALRMHHRS